MNQVRKCGKKNVNNEDVEEVEDKQSLLCYDFAKSIANI